MKLGTHLVIPIASEADATATCEALEPYLEEVERITAIHVIKKAGGTLDKASPELRREEAEVYLSIVESRLADLVTVETEIAYGTDVVETIFEQATTVNATAVAFRARGGSRILRLLTGDKSSRLITEPDIPVVSLPDP